ncbi:Cytochrome c biogenesis ATP-binding export protein CcmA [Tsuneonella dongtanensis]|uniref:Cytochrome c biogenesis ATP-binding export protein CcmA n=1 Tax=Tsuneonella dongtanensis TaxID=692370 RepID=A0A1B2AD24_9SPHN|nr:heme ABC exporter ATP-binding protein CcmA [Tsuneonella dongtanensis]ANY20001.1 Cytochrome c biogenesis ATP-binding export protein CcmA [Tsuneonella dongtanensis]
MEGARLAAHDIACRRGDRLLFAGLSFALGSGEALQIVGANGTGKSSLLRILAGLLRPYAGTVERDGAIALLDGNLPLDAHLPLGKALDFWARLDGVPLAAEPALADVPVRFLSTGQRKRAAVVQSHPREGGVWLLDEPLNGLDTGAVEALQARVSDHCARGGIAVIASHQPFTLDGLKRIDLAEFAA